MENQDLKELIEIIDSYQYIGDTDSELSIERKVLDGLLKAFIDPIKEIIMQRSDSGTGLDNDIKFMESISKVVLGLNIFFSNENAIKESVPAITAQASGILDIDVFSATAILVKNNKDTDSDVLINNIHVN